MSTKKKSYDRGDGHKLVDSSEPIEVPQAFQQVVALATVASSFKVLETPQDTLNDDMAASMGNRMCELPCIFLKNSDYYADLTDGGTTAASKESPSNEAASSRARTRGARGPCFGDVGTRRSLKDSNS